MQADATQHAADELYALPPDEFVQARDELVRRLRGDGLRDEAKEIKALRKPTLPAWAVNQLARHRAKDVAKLLEAGRSLREAQEELLAGGERSALHSASAAERELVAQLTRDVVALAAEAGVGSTASLEEKVGATLHAAALEEETAADLEAGRLVREREAAAGFGVPAMGSSGPPGQAEPKGATGQAARKGAQGAKASRGQGAAASRGPGAKATVGKTAKGRPDAGAKRRRERQAKLRKELEGARRDEREARKGLDTASKAARRAEDLAEQAQRRAAEAARQAEGARDELAEAEDREKAATAAHDRAVKAIKAAEKKLG